MLFKDKVIWGLRKREKLYNARYCTYKRILINVRDGTSSYRAWDRHERNSKCQRWYEPVKSNIERQQYINAKDGTNRLKTPSRYERNE